MKKITEDYVSFEIAKILKEKGFDITLCNTCYKYNGKFCNNRKSMSGVDNMICYPAPTLQMARKWLREKHKLFIDITAAMEDYIEDGVVKYKDPYYTWEVFSLEIGETLYFGGTPNVKESYEEACESAIKYCLENLI